MIEGTIAVEREAIVRYPEYIVRLVTQVVTVSLETMKIVDGLPTEFGGPLRPEATDDARSAADAPKKTAAVRGESLTLRADDGARQTRLGKRK